MSSDSRVYCIVGFCSWERALKTPAWRQDEGGFAALRSHTNTPTRKPRQRIRMHRALMAYTDNRKTLHARGSLQSYLHRSSVDQAMLLEIFSIVWLLLRWCLAGAYIHKCTHSCRRRNGGFESKKLSDRWSKSGVGWYIRRGWWWWVAGTGSTAVVWCARQRTLTVATTQTSDHRLRYRDWLQNMRKSRLRWFQENNWRHIKCQVFFLLVIVFLTFFRSNSWREYPRYALAYISLSSNFVKDRKERP